MNVGVEQLMERIGDLGVTVIIKVDGERAPEEGRWTFVASGGPFAEEGPIRIDGPSLDECLSKGLSLIKSRGEEWRWLEGIRVSEW